MMTFDDVMVLTRTVSSPAAFSDAECRAYFDLLMSLPEGARVVEVGLQFGRSSSIVARVSKEKHFDYVGIDPFTDPPEAAPAWIALMRKIDVPFTLYCMKTQDVELWQLSDMIYNTNLILIDGDHNAKAVKIDCEAAADNVLGGGYALFHDYGVKSLPNVYPIVNAHMVQGLMRPQQWVELPTVDTLGIWKRL